MTKDGAHVIKFKIIPFEWKLLMFTFLLFVILSILIGPIRIINNYVRTVSWMRIRTRQITTFW